MTEIDDLLQKYAGSVTQQFDSEAERKAARRNGARHVAIYARVSTEHEEQLAALENQKDWYVPILAQHKEWDMVNMYVDEGITGTSAKKRPQFLQMIEDAKAGMFDLILTREISRFARNTIDTLQYIRQLTSYGVEVYFINDGIWTLDSKDELVLTILASLAQGESEKTSIRVKSGQQTSMEKGVYYGNGNILGYDRVGKEYKVNPEQARTVRMIYDWYLDGFGLRAIRYKLEQAGRLTATGKEKWFESNIAKILKNPFYCGILVYHKQWTPNYLEQKKINNLGDIAKTVVRGTHEPIITEDEFDLVQKKIEQRHGELVNLDHGKHLQLGKRKPSDVWTELLICECGHKFNRKVWHIKGDEIQYGYQCYGTISTGTVQTRLNKGLSIEGVCRVPMFPGWKLQMMAKHIFREYMSDTAQVLALAESMLAKHIDDPEPIENNERIIKQKQDERDKYNKRLHNLIEMRADGELSREVFLQKKEEVESRLAQLDKELSELAPVEDDPEEQATHEEKITILRYYLEQSISPTDTEDIPENVIRAFVKKIVVHEHSFDWYVRFSPDDDPAIVTVEGKRKSSAKVSFVCCPQHRQP